MKIIVIPLGIIAVLMGCIVAPWMIPIVILGVIFAIKDRGKPVTKPPVSESESESGYSGRGFPNSSFGH